MTKVRYFQYRAKDPPGFSHAKGPSLAIEWRATIVKLGQMTPFIHNYMQ
jgi:hypothetical protein